MTDTTDTKIIIGTERMTGSRNGNPRFRLIFRDGTTAPTAPDAGVAYGINNRENIGRPVVVTFNGRGHVTYVNPADPETVCAVCAATLPTLEPGHTGGTGYAVRADGSRVCYPCADAAQRAEIETATTFTAYLDARADYVTTWTGGRLAKVTGHTTARTGFHGTTVHRVWCQAPDGRYFYGQNGGPGMVITMRALKG